MNSKTHTSAYGNLEDATHILVQIKTGWYNNSEYYGEREYQNKTYYKTYYINSAKYFTLEEFVENYQNICNNLDHSDEFFIRFCHFPINPIHISKYNLSNYIGKSPVTIHDSLESIVWRIQNEIRRKVPAAITKTIYDPTKSVTYVNKSVKNGEWIETRGILETYQDDTHIIIYDETLKPNNEYITPPKDGTRYTSQYNHGYGDVIINTAVPKKTIKSVTETYLTVEKIIKNDPNLTKSDLQYHPYNDELVNYIPDKGYAVRDFEYGIRNKNDDAILDQYPDLQLGEIIKASIPPIIIYPSNKIVKYQKSYNRVTNHDIIINPKSINPISVETFLKTVVHSHLYNMPMQQINYSAKWFNGETTPLNVNLENKLYPTPYEAKHYHVFPDNNSYGFSIDISNLTKTEIATTAIRDFLLEKVAKSVTVKTTISVRYDDHVIIKIEPFIKDYSSSENTLWLNAYPNETPNLKHFRIIHFQKQFSQWKKDHPERFKQNEMKERLGVNLFNSENNIRNHKQIKAPKAKTRIVYIMVHPKSFDLKIGRSNDWYGRYTLYVRQNPPIESIDPTSVLRYYLKTPDHEDHVIRQYLYVCAEYWLKGFTDQYFTRHKSSSGYTTEYYHIDNVNDEQTLTNTLNNFVDELVKAWFNLTLKDLADIRPPAKNGDGIHGGKRQQFFNKINEDTKENIYDVELALKIISKLDSTTKFKDYPNPEETFLPELVSNK